VALITPGDPQALAAQVAEWATESSRLPERGQAADTLYQSTFSAALITRQLRQALASLSQ